MTRASYIISTIVYVLTNNRVSYRCDVFIENSKSLLQAGSEDQNSSTEGQKDFKTQRESTLQTLYSALEGALVLSHPFLPFITEELWQRLPRRPGDETESVMLARYPEWDQALDDPVAETTYNLVLGCAKGIRSLMAEYGGKERIDIFIQAYEKESQDIISKEVSSIHSLGDRGATSAMSIKTLGPKDDRPSGCVSFPVSSSVSVFIHVKGRVDLDEEISKAEKKLEKAQSAAQKQRKLVNDPVYIEKVAVATQDTDKQKLADLESEASGFEATIKQFKELKLE